MARHKRGTRVLDNRAVFGTTLILVKNCTRKAVQYAERHFGRNDLPLDGDYPDGPSLDRGISHERWYPICSVLKEPPIVHLGCVETGHLESIRKSPPLPLGEGWGEGRRTSELIEKTGSDSSHPHPRVLSRRTGEGRLSDGLQLLPARENPRASLIPKKTFSREFSWTIPQSSAKRRKSHG